MRSRLGFKMNVMFAKLFYTVHTHARLYTYNEQLRVPLRAVCNIRGLIIEWAKVSRLNFSLYSPPFTISLHLRGIYIFTYTHAHHGQGEYEYIYVYIYIYLFITYIHAPRQMGSITEQMSRIIIRAKRRQKLRVHFNSGGKKRVTI